MATLTVILNVITLILALVGVGITIWGGGVNKSKKVRLLAILFFVAAMLTYSAGDKARRASFKTEMMSYYENRIDYDDLTDKQKKNIDSCIYMYRSSIPLKDREKYLPALMYYVPDFFTENHRENEIEGFAEKYLAETEEERLAESQ